MKDRFCPVSHEMKTPLTGILSGTELLLSLKEDDDSRVLTR
jgi:signal transduction histidine kinase